MATLAAPSSSRPAEDQQRQAGLIQEIRMFWRQFFVAAFDPYRPELHYMRGPGPACRAKNSAENRASRSH
ncbi:hypothetical protein ONR75_28045 [Rhodopseudomonas sp. P2A-2r]|uniref:hypothetical protein n=1 Tax=Rhodopseudomonas sp. P2A-2r TaxID=2991972 RepID=UPI0022342948|nr:hypothetical protein [Rhodopseudomonas sp. P2A-2r]UZE48590.1 hypothetical protein ONR75_28045 [Rhodopseudomonas sp. P2A-2r]